jgi:hypothetical protein
MEKTKKTLAVGIKPMVISDQKNPYRVNQDGCGQPMGNPLRKMIYICSSNPHLMLVYPRRIHGISSSNWHR